MIPFSPPYIDEDIKNEVLETLDSGWITTGPKTKALEELVCEKFGVPKTLGVNSWTSGAILVLKWIGLKEDDEVIIPSYTYAATALAVIHAGAKPVMVDVKDDFTIDVDQVRKAITTKTKVIIPVDIGGVPADYEQINALVEEVEVKRKFSPGSDFQKELGRILVLSDAAHSIGAKYNGKYSGALTDISIFSLHAVKNITSAEGGLICLNLPKQFDNEEVYGLLRRFSLNGQTKDAFSKNVAGQWRYDIVEYGMKCNMADVNAAIALAQLRKYDRLLEERNRVYTVYNTQLKKHPWAITPDQNYGPNKGSCFHVYNLRVDFSEEVRDMIINYLAENGVAANVHFVPLPMLSAFKELKVPEDAYLNAERLYRTEISLPIYPQLSSEKAHYIVEKIIEAVNSFGGDQVL